MEWHSHYTLLTFPRFLLLLKAGSYSCKENIPNGSKVANGWHNICKTLPVLLVWWMLDSGQVSVLLFSITWFNVNPSPWPPLLLVMFTPPPHFSFLPFFSQFIPVRCHHFTPPFSPPGLLPYVPLYCSIEFLTSLSVFPTLTPSNPPTSLPCTVWFLASPTSPTSTVLSPQYSQHFCTFIFSTLKHL